ncbi:SDR family NAD(P)-dependent oxidoreductase [Elusimicrobiota bacterium]
MKLFITGMSSGLGLSLAKEFIALDDEVWGIGKRDLDVKSIDASAKGKSRYFKCDTANTQQVSDTFRQMIQADYIPDVVIFCAGSAADDVKEHVFSLEKFQENFNVNLFGILTWTEHFLPHFLKRNSGTFAAVSSMSAYRENHKCRMGYSASRIALNKTFENLSVEYCESGMRFIVFNMGRLLESEGIIGVTRSKAARRIRKIIKSSKRCAAVNIPFSQYVLTRMAQCIPDKLFKRYFMTK